MDHMSDLSAVTGKFSKSVKDDALMVCNDCNIADLKDFYTCLCDRLIGSINKGKAIDERTLIDFGKLAFNIARSNVEEISSSFDELASHVSDYWRYRVTQEVDTERKYSYIRLYQMINMVKMHQMESKLENRINCILERDDADYDAVFHVYNSPGITYKKLKEKIPPTDLDAQLDCLEKEGLIFARRTGEERYYTLTHAGDLLYQRYFIQQKRNKTSDEWGEERTFVLCYILEFLQSKGVDRIPILKIVERISMCEDYVITEMIKRICAVRNTPKGRENKRINKLDCENSNLIYSEQLPPSVSRSSIYRTMLKPINRIPFNQSVLLEDDLKHNNEMNIYEEVVI